MGGGDDHLVETHPHRSTDAGAGLYWGLPGFGKGGGEEQRRTDANCSLYQHTWREFKLKEFQADANSSMSHTVGITSDGNNSIFFST